MAEKIPDNGFPVPVQCGYQSPPSPVIETFNPFTEGVTPTVDAKSEPWYENLVEHEGEGGLTEVAEEFGETE